MTTVSAESLGGGRHRIATDCATVGLRAPPAGLDCQVSKATSGWILLTKTTGPPSATEEWLRLSGAIDVSAARPGAPMRARFGSLPDSIDIIARYGRINRLTVEPSGDLQLMVQATTPALRDMLEVLRGRPDDRDAGLTKHQEDLIELCVAHGYYAIPRLTTLRKMAKILGTSTTSLSLSLRRAEAKVMATYVGRKKPVDPAEGTRDSTPKEAGGIAQRSARARRKK